MARPLIVMPTVESPIRQVDVDGAAAFAERVFDPARLQPLVLVSTSRPHGDGPLISPDALYARLDGAAEVAVTTGNAASRALSGYLAQFNTWGGAVRLYLPDASPRDPWQRHPLFQVDPRHPDQDFQYIVARVRTAAGLHPATSAASSTLTAVRTAPETVCDTHEHAGADDERGAAELTRLAGQVADKERRLREQTETIADLRQQLQKLGKKLRAADRDSYLPPVPQVYDDPERQFRYEIEQHWLWTVPETDRDEHPLTDYRLGRDWLAALEAIELVDRNKILDVVVEVLTGRAVGSAARRPRRMRIAGSAPRTRADGAIAWRCDIKQGTAAAPRLMYWRLPDNTVELGRVAAHDDMQLR
ncbi:hypothetical protein [Streptomyces sp. NPDC050988]|uniref:hypothetical protein n=1 Tax=Streptomyces sp. NPDC050988 TaxID=3365637 RepID=UPI00378B9BC4